jgi:hypothetical protein
MFLAMGSPSDRRGGKKICGDLPTVPTLRVID